MKKITFFLLFFFPFAVYMFFATGVHNFSKLPVLHKVNDISDFKNVLKPCKYTLKNKITLLGFIGKIEMLNKSYLLNLAEKINNRFNKYSDFQIVLLSIDNDKSVFHKTVLEINAITDTKSFHLLSGSFEDIKKIFKGLRFSSDLNAISFSPYVFIIDKSKRLRSRNIKNINEAGYNALSIADVNNRLIDDIKVLLAEYRLRLKKYGGQSKRKELLNP